ncbi:DUF4214 domain-containing protein [Massilia sp. HP4]|uniref:DUF4214 domain-containing protein n=1 Tax=Massilia sp. HP4 TaxID=2562316 RepID=UPI0010C14055|nr:DUF4214 domain-containing protein [Massilia sp. HP4]
MSLWTVSIADTRYLLDQPTHDLIDKNVQYVMAYLDQFIDWKGTLDVRVNIKTNAELKSELGWTQDGIIPATEMSYFSQDGATTKSNLIEMTTGKDLNGSEPDAGFTIYLGADGTMRNYGAPVWLDPNPEFLKSPQIPPGAHDFISIALHEVLHTIAFDQANIPFSTLGSKVVLRDGVYYFEGEATMALLGRPLAFDEVGHIISKLTPQYTYGGMIGDIGNYEQNRWDIGRIELAVMQDLGIDVTLPVKGLPYTDLDDKRPNVDGTGGDDVLYGDFKANIITGGAGNDVLEGGGGNDILNGGIGLDTALYAGTAGGYEVRLLGKHTTVADRVGTEGIDTLEGIERIHFSDSALAFDVDGSAGKAFRIFQAAFDRAPDLTGLGFWIDRMDGGMSLQDVAAGFIRSDEFTGKYGALGADAFVTALYGNVLDRQPDQEGLDFWTKLLAGGDDLAARATVLANFSESKENVGNLAELIANGITFIPYG